MIRAKDELVWIGAIVAFTCVCAAAAGLPAFPGAEGFGSETPGGRGGKVHLVTHLNDAGPGSFREACQAEGPRIIVFAVGGTITLESNVEINHPFCTIAGQTASGDGICVRGASLHVRTHDVVVRHVRFRMGRPLGDKNAEWRDSIKISGTPPRYNIVLDHCSISWSSARNLSIWGDAHDLTVQWCIISEGLRDPEDSTRPFAGMGFLVGDRSKNISIHHCLFAHNYQRNPRLKHGVHADLVNNVVYNFSDSGAHLIGDFKLKDDAPAVHANLVNNWYQAGPDTPAHVPIWNALTTATLYASGNVSNHRMYGEKMNEALRHLTLSARPFPAAKVTVLSAKEAYERVLAGAGAICPRRDEVDERIARNVREGKGRYIRHEGEVGGFPKLAAGTARKDSDSDGMPDEWEKKNHLDPANPEDARADNNGNGYTNIEEWINGLAEARPRVAGDSSTRQDQRGKNKNMNDKDEKVYGVGILGNSCTHGAGLCRKFISHRRTRVVAAYERNPRRAKELQERLGRPLVSSYDAVINHPDVDFVAISCNPCDKPDMVEKAAAAGKPIFLNKPIADSLDGARRIAQAVKKHNVPFVHDIPMVRFVEVYARLLQEVRAGKYGQVMGYHHLFGMNFAPDFNLKDRWPERLDPPEKSGGGEMTNMGCYAIDFAVSLFGRPRTVTAKWRKTWDVYQEADVENFGQIVLDYGDFFAFLEVGKQQLDGERKHSNSMTINFEHTTLLIDASAKLVAINHVAQDYDRFAAGAKVVGSVEQLFAAIEHGTPPTSNIETAVLAAETLMAAYRSIVEGRTVALPLPSGENPLTTRPK